MLTKRCSSCKAIKPIDQFYRNKSTRDGRHNQCKLCLCLSNAASVRKNPDRVKRNKAAYRARHPELEVLRRVKARDDKRARVEAGMSISVSDSLLRYYKSHTSSPVLYLVCQSPPGSGPFKIGVTANLPHRIRSLSASSPVALEVFWFLEVEDMDIARDLENQAMYGNSDIWIHGEWHRWDAERVAAICTLTPEQRFVYTRPMTFKMHPEDRRSVSVMVRLTKAEHERLCVAAGRRPLAEWVHNVVMERLDLLKAAVAAEEQ